MEDPGYSFDRTATATAYEDAAVKKCECAYCRNLDVARARTFPPSFLQWLRDLGVDPDKEAEFFHYGRDEGASTHWYGGLYHFVGQVNGEAQALQFGPDLKITLRPAGGEPRALSLSKAELVCVDFSATAVPWLLDEPNPE